MRIKKRFSKSFKRVEKNLTPKLMKENLLLARLLKVNHLLSEYCPDEDPPIEPPPGGGGGGNRK